MHNCVDIFQSPKESEKARKREKAERENTMKQPLFTL